MTTMSSQVSIPASPRMAKGDNARVMPAKPMIEKGAFITPEFQPWMGKQATITAIMDERFGLALADFIFDQTNNQDDPDLIAFAHRVQNFFTAREKFFDKR